MDLGKEQVVIEHPVERHGAEEDVRHRVEGERDQVRANELNPFSEAWLELLAGLRKHGLRAVHGDDPAPGEPHQQFGGEAPRATARVNDGFASSERQVFEDFESERPLRCRDPMVEVCVPIRSHVRADWYHGPGIDWAGAGMQEEAMAVGRGEPSLTPMMRQYFEVKSKCSDCILFFRLGDFYEMFAEDAVKASELLQITLTARAKGADRIPMCGVPYHAARRYIAKLVAAGLKVAICEQMEAPGKDGGPGPGIVRREVVRIITPGTVLDAEALEATQNNFLAALVWTDTGAGAALLDASTGDFYAVEGPSLAGLMEELGRAEPRELLVMDSELGSEELARFRALFPKTPSLAALEPTAFEPARAAAYLRAHFSVAGLDGFGLGSSPLATAAAGAALRYVKETQRTDARHVDRVSLWQRGTTLVMDEASRANLEILRTLRDGGRKGSLLGILDRTVTAAGARTLGRWLSAPLCALPEIEARLEAVDELRQKGVVREALTAGLKRVADLERAVARLATNTGNARDLALLAHSLAALPAVEVLLQGLSAPLWTSLAGPLGEFGPLAEKLGRAILDEPAVGTGDGGMIRPGFDAELDALVSLSTTGKAFLLELELRERERTGIASLKVRYNRVFGYYLEVTRANLHRVPEDYLRKQTTVGAERFVTPELKDHEEQVLTAEERRGVLELRLFEELRSEVIGRAPELRAAAQALAIADVLRSFALCAAEYSYVRPTVEASDVLEILGGRHPVVERMLDGVAFVPNDVRMDRQRAQLIILTGPNMAGKSTVMRQVALTVLMAQVGSFVPARSARIGLCDRIFTRVGAADNLAQGQSTFMVEMTETSNILHNATARSLIILDEIGRGTSTFDGLSIAWAVAEHIHDRIGARTLFATHYHELTDLSREKRRAKNFSMAVKEVDGGVVFLRKLLPEGASRSYGIEVARLAGLPPEVVTRAREILANLESGEWDESGRPRVAHARVQADPNQLGLFVAPVAALPPPEPPAPPPSLFDSTAQQVVDAVTATRVEVLTPLEALNLLAAWQKLLKDRVP